MADRLRGSHRRGQTTAWTGSQPVQGDAGIKRWVGLGVIADNLVNISRAMAKQPSR
jgi:hypothetical protein